MKVRREVVLAESPMEVNGEPVVGPPKTHQEQTVTLPPSVASALADHLAANVPSDPDALVFAALEGSLRYSNFRRRQWDPAVHTAGLPSVTPHPLRHTAAPLLLDAGASVKDVQRQLGHADAAVTLNIYSTVIEGRSDDLAARREGIRQAAGTPGNGMLVARKASS